MTEIQTQSVEELDLEMFNVSEEFEDINFEINEHTFEAEMVVVARRC